MPAKLSPVSLDHPASAGRLVPSRAAMDHSRTDLGLLAQYLSPSAQPSPAASGVLLRSLLSLFDLTSILGGEIGYSLWSSRNLLRHSHSGPPVVVRAVSRPVWRNARRCPRHHRGGHRVFYGNDSVCPAKNHCRFICSSACDRGIRRYRGLWSFIGALSSSIFTATALSMMNACLRIPHGVRSRQACWPDCRQGTLIRPSTV